MELQAAAMDFNQNEYVKLRGGSFGRDFSHLKKISKFLPSVSVFSLALAFSLSNFSLFPHSFSVYFSTYLFSLFTHTIERKYMFLVCNGILFFLAKCSTDSYCTFSLSEFDHLVGEDSDSGLSIVKARYVSEEEEEVEEETATEEVEENRCFQELDDQLEAENLSEEEEEEGEEDEVSLGDEEEEQEEVTATASTEEVTISTEELNKRIEEFIRKMKEEMRIEAKTQLIAV